MTCHLLFIAFSQFFSQLFHSLCVFCALLKKVNCRHGSSLLVLYLSYFYNTRIATIFSRSQIIKETDLRKICQMIWSTKLADRRDTFIICRLVSRKPQAFLSFRSPNFAERRLQEAYSAALFLLTQMMINYSVSFP